MSDKKPEDMREELFSEAFHDYYYDFGSHECVPYCGITHVESTCGVCGRAMNEDQVNAFRRKL
jgi:hypothetical protein